MTQTTGDESAGAEAEAAQVVRLSLRVDVRDRLAAEARREGQRRVDVVLAAVQEHEAELSEVLDSYAGARPSALFGTIRSRADDRHTPTVVSSIAGMLPGQRSWLERIAVRHRVRVSRLVSAVLDHHLPTT